jgi:hypothetical protein
MALACVAHMADRMANDARECVNDVHCTAKGVYQFPISFTIFLEGLCSILEEVEDLAGRIRLFESDSKRSLREVCSSEFCIVGQGGIDYRLDVSVRCGRCGRRFLCGRRHEESGGVGQSCVRSRMEWTSMEGGKGEGGLRVRSDGRATGCRRRRRKAVKTPVPHEAR